MNLKDMAKPVAKPAATLDADAILAKWRSPFRSACDTSLVVDEETGLVVRACLQPRYVRHADGHLGGVE